jgi:hypothetical protein
MIDIFNTTSDAARISGYHIEYIRRLIRGG